MIRIYYGKPRVWKVTGFELLGYCEYFVINNDSYLPISLSCHFYVSLLFIFLAAKYR